MSQENVEIVQRHLAARNRRDLMTLLALWRSDAEIDWSQSRGPLKGVYCGHRELEAFWNELWSTFEVVQVEAHGFTEIGSEVVVPNTAHLHGREGIEVVARSTFVFTVENGQITRQRLFQEEVKALEAARISQQDAHADS
jgi:ketosteroid isomerase-like protein